MNIDDLIMSLIAVILSSVAAIIGKKLNDFLRERNISIKSNRVFQELYNIVFDSVKVTYQTYVEYLKDSSEFDILEQKNALNLAKEHVYKNLPKDIFNYIKVTYPDINRYIELQIEKVIYELKK